MDLGGVDRQDGKEMASPEGKGLWELFPRAHRGAEAEASYR